MFKHRLTGALRFWSRRSLTSVRPRMVLGIESSCDETGAAVMDETGRILGESLHSQKENHLKAGGINPAVAQRLHSENICRVVQDALDRSAINPCDLTAVATTVKPGLSLCLAVGLDFSLKFVREHKKPIIPIHHMEAHALTVRMLHRVDFPFLVLLVSGGHSLLALARGIDDFLLLGQTLDEAAGDTLDKIGRRLSVSNYPECSTLSGGQAIEFLAKEGDRHAFCFTLPMEKHKDCNFSFSGFRTQVTKTIMQKEKEEGISKGQLLSCAKDIAAATQYTLALHVAKGTYRAIQFCKSKGLLPEHNPTLVVSGGVASNAYIRRTLKVITNATGLHLLCPPSKYCTDNGVMIAWNGIERLKEGKGILSHTEEVVYAPKAPLGIDITSDVKDAAINVPSNVTKIICN